MGMIRCSCPACQLALNLGEVLAGRQIKCPRCSTPVTVPSVSASDPIEAAPFEPEPQQFASPLQAALPVDLTAYENTPASAEAFGVDGIGNYDGVALSHEDMAAWRRVCKGLRRFLTGLMVFAAAVIARASLVAIAILVAGALGSERASAELPFINGCDVLISLGILISWAFALVGLVEGLHVPSNSGCKPFVFVALVSVGGAIVLHLFTFLAQFNAWVDDTSPRQESPAYLAAIGFLMIAAWATTTVMMLLFVHRVGTLLQSTGLCRQVWRFAAICGGGAGLMLVCYVGIVAAAGGLASRSSGSMALILVFGLGLVILATFLFVLARYSMVIGQTLQAIDRKGITS